MGCSAQETLEIQTKKDTIEYESYSKSDPKTFEMILYSLDWKTRPEICFFQKLWQQNYERSCRKYNKENFRIYVWNISYTYLCR